MTTCSKTWTREGFKFKCSLPSKHDGPHHLDEKHDDAYMDASLPEPPPPDVTNIPLPTNPDDDSM